MRLALVLLTALLVPTAAQAYPQFQLSTGAQRCNTCHFAPAGGGLLNGYGRSEAGDTISSGGDGRLLHGLWTPPSWLALGGDLRLAGLASDVGAVAGVDSAFIPMQADLYLRLAAAGFSVALTGGFRGTARGRRESFGSRLISREHYVMWRSGPVGWYARAGRFFVPFGLRLAEHTAYVRRFLGFDLLEETYGVSGGFVGDDWELHLSAFIPDLVRAPVGQRESGGAASFERRVGQRAAWGAQARVAANDAQLRAVAGLVGKLYLDGPRILVLAEADVARQRFAGIGASRWQLAAYLGAAWFPRRGLMVQAMLERWDEDLAVKGVARDAVGAELQWFPTAHVELGLYGRAQLIGAGAGDGAPSGLVLLQLHYYL